MGATERTPTILVLGGTAEADALARALAEQSRRRVITSLAGRTSRPRLPLGETRIGGFGGVAGLQDYLDHARIDAVIDATHPFAARIGAHAAQACHAAGLPLLRLDRPAWIAQSGDCWHLVADWAQAAARIAGTARRVLLALGRQDVAAFAALDDLWFLIRSVAIPDPLPPFAQAEFLAARPPFTVADEIALLRRYAIDTVVCKNSGGPTDAKLTAARHLGLPVVMRDRPPRPVTTTVTSVAEALAWLEHLLAV